MLEGKDATVGVEGRTLTEVCGDLDDFENGTEEWMELEVEEVEEAFEWVGKWWMLRMEDTDDEVDLRPLKPPEA